MNKKRGIVLVRIEWHPFQKEEAPFGLFSKIGLVINTPRIVILLMSEDIRSIVFIQNVFDDYF